MVLGAVAPLLLGALLAVLVETPERRIAPLFLALVVALAVVAGPRAAAPAALTSAAVLWVRVYARPDPLTVTGGRLADLGVFVASVALVVVLIVRLDRAVRATRRSARLVEDFVARAPVGIGVVDRDLRFELVNPELAAINRVPTADHLGRRLTELADDPTVDGLEARMRRVLASGTPEAFETAGPARPGSRRAASYAVSYLPLGAHDDDPATELAIIVRDITAEREADRRNRRVTAAAEALALAASDAQAAELLAAVLVPEVADGVRLALLDDDDRLRVAAVAGAASPGPGPGTTVDLAAVTPLTDAARDAEVVEVVDDDHHVIALPVRLRTADDVLGVLELTWRQPVDLTDADHHLHQTLATLAGGALSRVRAVDELSRDLFRLALDAMLDDVVIGRAVRDHAGRIVDFLVVHANHHSRDRAGRGPDAMVGRRVTDLYPGWVEQGMLERFAQVVDTGAPFVADELAYLDVTPDGARIEGTWRLQVVRFGDGYLATSRDITEQVRLREQARHDAALLEQERFAVTLLQAAALPAELPDVPGLDLAAAYLPATLDTPVGGDWYDAFTTEDGRVALVVGDVAGHGRASAARMLEARSLLHACAVVGDDPSTVLARTNRLLAPLWQAQTFATCIVCLLDPRTGEVTVGRAGHPLPVRAGRAHGTVATVAGGPPIGIADGVTFPTSTLVLDPDERLLLYSDGLVESRRRSIDEGAGALAALALGAAARGLDAAALCGEIIDAATVEDRPDDVCLLVAHRTA